MSNPADILPPAYDPTHAESTWYPIWEKAGHFSPDMTSSGEPFSIVIPPPNVTGSLHMGHALTMTLEDVLARWRRMQGKKTLWLPGTDHAGIATQMVVERDLAKTEKKSRHDLGRAAFLKRVWDWKRAYGDRITRQLRVLGCSLDWTRERFTMDEQLSRAVVEVFVRLHQEGLIYRAERLVNWCPRCYTALSDLEVDHDEGVQGELWSFGYPLAESDGEVVVATTRPETMLGDTAVAVHPADPRYQNLIGKHVRHPILGYRIPIVGDAVLVDPKFGTGAVKVTPAHDFNDFETGKRHKLVLFNIFDVDAKIRIEPDLRPNREADPIRGAEAFRTMRAETDLQRWGAYAGLDRMAARKKVKDELKSLGLERKSEVHVMAIGHCQRCETIVEPSLSVQWFVKTKPLAEPALAAVKTGATRIIPETWTKTYYHWMENIQDWCISRQLWWGHRIPAFYCRDCDNGTGSDDNPHFDTAAVPIVSRTAPAICPRCGGNKIIQDPDVLDTWFSSALWPFSTLGWPDVTDDLKAFYPISVMETGFDILFFWVARMMMMGCKFMGKPPFPDIYLHAMVRDKYGDKMSKTRGNVIDPLHLIHGCTAAEVSIQFKDEYPNGFPAFGADALRFTFAALSASGRDIKLSVERIAGYRAFANKIWNAARFMLMRLSGRPKPLAEVRSTLKPADRWILSRLASTVAEVNAALEAYRFSDAAQATYSFFWNELCDWYIELVKPRLAGDNATTKAAAETTLVYALDNALRLLHPFMPFITEEIWQKLPIDRPTPSIMKAPFPAGLKDLVNPEIEAEYKLVQDAIVAMRTIRAESNVAPSKLIASHVAVPDPEDRRRLTVHADEIRSMAKVETLTIAARFDKMANAAGKVLERMEIVVPLLGLVDFAEEAGRIKKAIDKAETERDRLLKKLANESFIARAPTTVVEKDRARAAELDTMLGKLRASLADLPPH